MSEEKENENRMRSISAWLKKEDKQNRSIFLMRDHFLSNNLNLSWRNISLEIEKKKSNNYIKEIFGEVQVETIQVLKEVYGVVKSGSLTAIMGPSGAGKTSLLATISLRMKGKILGEILLNGEPVDIEIMSRMSGFVPQQDLAIESLNVQEHMEFMATMKLDRKYNITDIKQKIAMLLAELGLTKCCSTKLSTLSCGERKRVSLAVQLLTEPRVLFCDEPTTGLDSFAALTVTRILKNIATQGCIVICTLHQPASGLLDLFDEIILLSNGRLAFQGSTSEALKFFSSINIQCPPTFNRAEFFVKQLSIDRGKEVECQKKIKKICDEFEKSCYSHRLIHSIDESCSEKSIIDVPHPIFAVGLVPESEFLKVHFLMQIRCLTWRIYIDHKRNLSTIFLRFGLYMFLSILLSFPYIGIMKSIDQKAIQNIQGLLYLIITETIFTYNYAVFHTFPNELPLLLREVANGLYNPASYYISKIILSVPGIIIQPLFYAIFIYLVVGLGQSYVDFMYFVIPIILSAFSASAMGYLMSAVFESINTASLLSVPIDFLTLIFSGLFLQLRNLPPYIAWLKYISQFYYGVEAISLIQWQKIENIDCSKDPEEPCIFTGVMVLEKYGYDNNHYFVDCIGLIAIFIISHLIGFVAIRLRSHKQPVY